MSDMYETFYRQSLKLGKVIQDDTRIARKIFSSLEREINYNELIIKKNNSKIVELLNHLGEVIHQWTESYPLLLKQFSAIINQVIKELDSSNEVQVHISGNDVRIQLNEQQFMYNVEHGKNPILIPKDEKEYLAHEEKLLLKDIEEIITLDFTIRKFLNQLEQITEENNIKTHSIHLANLKNIEDPTFITAIKHVSHWWENLTNTFHDMKSILKDAAELEGEAAKEFHKLLDAERRDRVVQARKEIAMGGLSVARDLLLDLVPGGAFISLTHSFLKNRDKILETARSAY